MCNCLNGIAIGYALISENVISNIFFHHTMKNRRKIIDADFTLKL